MKGNNHIKVGDILQLKKNIDTYKGISHQEKLKCIGFAKCPYNTGCTNCKGMIILENSVKDITKNCATSYGELFFEVVSQSWRSRLI